MGTFLIGIKRLFDEHSNQEGKIGFDSACGKFNFFHDQRLRILDCDVHGQ